MPQGGMAFVYVTDPAQARRAAAETERRSAPGSKAWTRSSTAPTAPRSACPRRRRTRAWAISCSTPRTATPSTQGLDGARRDPRSKNYLGTHGYPNSDPELDGIFIASGYGIKPRHEVAAHHQPRRRPDDRGTARRAAAQRRWPRAHRNPEVTASPPVPAPSSLTSHALDWTRA